MKDDQIETSTAQETQPSENIETNTNYSRWMTDMAAEIAHLKLHQLAIPGAHDSGVDMAGTWGVAELLGANQNNTFPQQLAAGARYLDLRLVDSSYTKMVGNFAPQMVFTEVFEFKHNIVSAGRRLEHLIRDIKNFVTDNPNEIVILDFHSYDRGTEHSGNSLERCLPYFNPIKHLLIPPSAKDLPIRGIRALYPEGKIILAFDHNYPVPRPNKPGDPTPPDKWEGNLVQREQIWSTFQHIWNSQSYSEQAIAELVTRTMESPPNHHNCWALSAAARNASGAQHLSVNSPVRTETFKQGYQNANIVMVDFIEREETRISVVDRCIALNKLRSADRAKPTTPYSLSVNPIDTIDRPNTLIFRFHPATDDIGVRRYQVYRNGIFLFSTTSTLHREKNVNLRNYTFRVKALDTVDNESDFSESFDLIQDTTPPTVPENFQFHPPIGFNHVTVRWDHSFDEAGVEAYELYSDSAYVGSTTEQTYTFRNLITTNEYTFKLRAKDINGLYSEYTELTLRPRPGLTNPRTIITEDLGGNKYKARILWDFTDTPQAPVYCGYKIGSTYTTSIHREGETPSIDFDAQANENIKCECNIEFLGVPIGTPDQSEVFTHEFTFDPVPPPPVTHLEITSRTSTSTSVAWTLSTDPGVINYAISLNQEPPILVSPSTISYVFEQLPLDKSHCIDVWAIKLLGTLSTIESITVNAVPGKPGTPIISQVTGTSAKLDWSASTPTPLEYLLTLNDADPIRIPSSSTSYILNNLEQTTNYRIEIRAKGDYDTISEPSLASFATKDETPPSKPGPLEITEITESTAKINWTASTDNVAVTAYEITLDDGIPHTIRTNTYSFTNLKEGTSHNIRVVAKDGDGNVSEPSSASFATKDITPPSKPGAPRIINIGLNSADGSWVKSSDANGIKGYKITLNNEYLTTVIDNKYTFIELQEGSHYTLEIRAIDNFDNFSEPSTATFRTKVRPTSPTHLNYSNLSSSSVKLSWLPGSDDERIVGYQVSRNGTPLRLVFGTSYEVNWLSPDRLYVFEVRTKDNDGYLSDPARLEVTTTQAPTRPGPVRNLRLNTDISPMLTWRPPETGAAIQYIISRDDQFWAARPGSPNPLCLIEMPPTGKAYFYEVRARDMADQYSDPESIRIGTVAPESLQAINLTGTSFTLIWEIPADSVGVIGYQVTLDDGTPFAIAETQYTFTDLTQGSTYTVMVQTRVESGELSEPASILVYLQGQLPSAPSNLRYKFVLFIDTLEWDVPSDTADISGYNIILIGPEGNEVPYNSIEPTLSTLLLRATRYDVRITTVNPAGESRPLISEITTR
jgi:hypothetical protein